MEPALYPAPLGLDAAMEEPTEVEIEIENPDSLAISAGIKIKPVPEGNRADVSISFVTSRVKDTVVRIVNEDQIEMFTGGDDGD